MRNETGLLTRGCLPRRLPGSRQWLRGGGASPLTAAGPSRICTGFPHRAPMGRAYHRTVAGPSSTLAARPRWAALIFAFSSVPDLGTGLGGWDVVLRKIAHAAEYAVLGALLLRAILALGRVRARRAVRGLGRDPPVVHRGTAGLAPRRRARRGRGPGGSRSGNGPTRCARDRASAIAVDLDGALGDTQPLWRDWLTPRARVLGVEPHELPADRRRPPSSSTAPVRAAGGSSSSGSPRTGSCLSPPRGRGERCASAARRRGRAARRVHGRTGAARTRGARPARRGAQGRSGRERGRARSSGFSRGSTRTPSCSVPAKRLVATLSTPAS